MQSVTIESAKESKNGQPSGSKTQQQENKNVSKIKLRRAKVSLLNI